MSRSPPAPARPTSGRPSRPGCGRRKRTRAPTRSCRARSSSRMSRCARPSRGGTRSTRATPSSDDFSATEASIFERIQQAGRSYLRHSDDLPVRVCHDGNRSLDDQNASVVLRSSTFLIEQLHVCVQRTTSLSVVSLRLVVSQDPELYSQTNLMRRPKGWPHNFRRNLAPFLLGL